MSKTIDKYTYHPSHDLIATGSSGKIYKGTDKKLNKQVALKQISKGIIRDDEAVKQALIDEIHVIQKIQSPKVVQMIEVLSSDNNYYLVFEYCKEDLQHYLKVHHKLEEAQVIKLLKDLMEAYIELMKNGLVHGGIKPSNIMVTDDGYKLTDCGFSKCLESFTKVNQQQHNFLYQAPEVLQSQKYTNKSDIWSLGMVLYNCLFGYTRWFGRTQEELLKNIQVTLLEFPDQQVKISSDMKNLLEGCLEQDEHHRFSWDNLFSHKLVAEHFKNYKDQIKMDQIKYIMNDLRQKIIKQNIDIMQLFKSYDIDGSDTLEYQEFNKLLKQIDKSISPYDCKLIFQKLDLDHDKTISFDEFAKWLTNNNTKMTLLSGKFRNAQSQKRSKRQLDQAQTAVGPQSNNDWGTQFVPQNPVPYDNNPQPPSIPVQPQPNFGLIQQPQQQWEPPIQQTQPQTSVIINTSGNSIEKTILAIKKQIKNLKDINLYDLFIRVDVDRDNMLSFQEFASMIIFLNFRLQDKEMWDIFKIFDLNEDNLISFIELKQVLNMAVEKPQSMIMTQNPYAQPNPYQQPQYNPMQQSMQFGSQTQIPPQFASQYPNQGMMGQQQFPQYNTGYSQQPFQQQPQQQQMGYSMNFSSPQQFQQQQQQQFGYQAQKSQFGQQDKKSNSYTQLDQGQPQLNKQNSISNKRGSTMEQPTNYDYQRQQVQSRDKAFQLTHQF